MTSTPVQPAESVNGIPVKRSARRSRISIRLHPDGSCELLAPLHVTRSMLETALQQCQSWLERKRKIQTAVPAEFQTHKFEFAPGKTVFYCGKPFVLQLRQTALSRRIIMLDELLITPSAQADEIQVLLEAFYRRQIRQIVTALLEKYSQCFNITFGKVSINGARGRFGSCNSSGNMNFSWHLAM